MRVFAAIVLLLVVGAIAQDACCAVSAPVAAQTSGTGVAERLGSVVPADISLYDSSGEPVLLGSLIQRPTILLPVYYGCTNICPAALSDLAGVLTRLSSVPGSDYSVLTVSFDYNDSPADALRNKRDYMKAAGRTVPEGAWRFLTGDRDNLSRLVSSLGYELKRDGDGFTHPSGLVILSPGRKIIRYIYGSALSPAELEMAFVEARAGTVGPTVPKVLRFCFRYDPASRKYVFDSLKITGLGVLAGAAVFFFYLTKKKRDGR